MSAAQVKRPASNTNTIPLDTFDRGFLEWITLGGVKLDLAPAGVLAEPALEASYGDTPDSFVMMTRRLTHADLAGATTIAFDIASEREATLAVSFELRDAGKNNGPRYSLTIFPPGNRRVFPVALKFNAFDHDPNSPTGSGKLDPALIKTITIVDVSGPSGGDSSANKLWIGNLRALRD